jgi:integral membrane sensor domain MASE1
MYSTSWIGKAFQAKHGIALSSHSDSKPPSPWNTGLWILILAALYFGTGKLGLLLAVPPGYATIIWPPSGIALGLLIVRGRRLWPGILLGSFILNMITSSTNPGTPLQVWDVKTLSAFSIAAGSTLQAWVGYALIQKTVGLPLQLRTLGEVFRIFFLVGPLSCCVAATVGTAALWMVGILDASHWVQNLTSWWVGDVFGVMIFLPLVLVFPGANPKIFWKKRGLQQFPLIAMMVVLMPLGLTFYSWKILSEQSYRQNLGPSLGRTRGGEKPRSGPVAAKMTG